MTALPNRILVLAPHPDDEVLLAGGVMHRAVLEQKQIFVAIATNGDYLCSDSSKGEHRLAESLAALRFLGVPVENIFFLGYPDTGFEPEVSFLNNLLCAENPRTVFPSARGTATYGIPGIKEDYAFVRTCAHASYCAQSFAADLDALIAQTAPELILTTACGDLHGDHTALSAFVRRALQKRQKSENGKKSIALWEGFVHSPAGDDKWPRITADMPPMTRPDNFEATQFCWRDRISIPLPGDMLCAKAEDSMKHKAICLYPSALCPAEPEVCAYLLSFTKADEVFFSVF